MRQVSAEEKRQARQVDLISFLEEHHPGLIKPAGAGRAKLVEHDSCIFTRGRGYSWNSKNETGNSIDFLMRYLNYSFVDAVSALCAHGRVEYPSDAANPNFELPEPFDGRFRRVFGYLVGRGISQDTIQRLIQAGVLYEDKAHHNAVFVAASGSFAELSGTLSDIRFKGIVSNSDPDGYWSFGDDTPTVTYVCESAIDAISLFELKKEQHARYCSMAGLKINTLRRIDADYPGTVVIAVDNDDAGNNFASLSGIEKRVIPNGKDWNEDLQQLP